MAEHACGCLSCQDRSCVEKVPIFASLDSSQSHQVAGLIRRKTFAKGELIITEGSVQESLIIINRGQVKAYRYTREGREQILYIFAENDFFGEKNLLGKQESSYNVEALEETGVCMIDKINFQELLREHPDIGLKVMEELCARLFSLERNLQNLGSKNAESRVIAMLLEFAEKYGKPQGRGILLDLPLSREGLANYIGVTRETVSRKLSFLHEERIIELIGNKRIIILDKRALAELA